MSKKVKKLLEEGTVRQFMKYADIPPTYTENFLDTVEEDEFEDEEPEMDMGAEPEMDMGAEPEMDMAPEADVDPELVQRIVSAVASAIEQETGVEVDVAGEEAPEADMDMGLPPEPGMEEEPEVEMTESDAPVPEGNKSYNREEDDDKLKEADDEKAEDKPVEEAEEFDYNSMVAEVARRVALRLVKENSKK
tara:strand:- start:6799 stop:7374 length:576 start_codon:yes stop_codon:yes gene_type:complete